MDYRTITLNIENGVARLTLNRQDKMNALSAEMLSELKDALKKVSVARENARVLLVGAAGRGFSAGLDLTAPRPDPEDREALLRDYFLPFYRMLKDLHVPTVAAVNGASIGAGMSLALTCDIVVAASSAYFLAAFTNIGVVPDTGASWLIPTALGVPRATGMLLLGEKLMASQAENWGLIWKCVDDDKLQEESIAIARKLAAGPSLAYDLTKRMTMTAVHSPYNDQLQLEVEYQRLVRDSADAAEARKAFMEKRSPVFRGR